MTKDCMNCQKYPMCRLYKKINEAIEEEGILFSSSNRCNYYKDAYGDDKS